MKRAVVVFISFLVGIPLGYKGISVFQDKVFKTPSVLSQSSDVNLSVTLTPAPTLSPTTTPIPTLTPTPTIKLTPTPSPTPTPRPIIQAPIDLEPLFEEFSSFYQVDKNKLKFIAKCESNFNVGVWRDPYAGLFQFDDITWTKYRNQMTRDPNINLRFGARESIETAAYVLSIGKQKIWPSCSATY